MNKMKYFCKGLHCRFSTCSHIRSNRRPTIHAKSSNYRYRSTHNCLTFQTSSRCFSSHQHARFCGSHTAADNTFKWTEPTGYDTGVKMLNSLTKNKERLILPMGKQATCAYIRLDVVRRILENYFGINPVLVMGITDIDDKIINRAKELSVDYRELATHFEKDFLQDLTRLRVRPPAARTRVTQYIPEIISFVQTIMDNGFAYLTPSGTVYFDVKKYGKYGQFVRNVFEDQIGIDAEKRNASDFALWKASKKGEPYWQSPWGPGRPGWHIECSTMASGGEDLRFPHHENEVAQCSAAFGKRQWVNYWLHTGYLHVKGSKQKMSKSLKNTVSVPEMLENYSVNQFRFFCLMHPYRRYIEYSDEHMAHAVSQYGRITSFLSSTLAYVCGQLQRKSVDEPVVLQKLEETRAKVRERLADDFDTLGALRHVEDLIHVVHTEIGRKNKCSGGIARSASAVGASGAYVQSFLESLGIKPAMHGQQYQVGSEQLFGPVVNSALKFRTAVRKYALNQPDLDDVRAADDVSAVAEGARAKRRGRAQDMQPLMKACDEFRYDLSLVGVTVQDHLDNSYWSMQEKHKAERTKAAIDNDAGTSVAKGRKAAKPHLSPSKDLKNSLEETPTEPDRSVSKNM